MDEDGGTLEICAILIDGTLERDAIVTLSISDNTAMGKYLLFEKIERELYQINYVDTSIMHHYIVHFPEQYTSIIKKFWQLNV